MIRLTPSTGAFTTNLLEKVDLLMKEYAKEREKQAAKQSTETDQGQERFLNRAAMHEESDKKPKRKTRAESMRLTSKRRRPNTAEARSHATRQRLGIDREQSKS